jgi:hypothetical protein
MALSQSSSGQIDAQSFRIVLPSIGMRGEL